MGITVAQRLAHLAVGSVMITGSISDLAEFEALTWACRLGTQPKLGIMERYWVSEVTRHHTDYIIDGMLIGL